MLAETGITRGLLHLAARSGILGVQAQDADTARQLAEASLLGFTLDDSVIAHRLVMRVVRERLAAEDRIAPVAAAAVRLLGKLADGITRVWHEASGVRELAAHVTALTAFSQHFPDGLGSEAAGNLFRLRRRSAYLLLELGDSTGLAILAAEPLAAGCERVLGTDHPDALASQNNLAAAYQAAGRTAEAIPLCEQTLDRERVLGTNHPDTSAIRWNLDVLRDALES